MSSLARMPIPKVILVAGVARSGSTALEFILANRSDSSSLGEIYAWYRPFRPHHIQPNCNCGRTLPECPVWSRIGRPPARHLHRAAADALGVNVVVDSSKNVAWIRDAHRWAQADDMDVHVILAWRGPKAVAYSYWKRGAGGWAENLEGYLGRLNELNLPWRALRFDGLVDHPREALAALYQPMGLSYSPGQERFWEGEFHSMFGSGGTRSQVAEGNSALESPQFPEEFEAYWSDLPCGVHARMEETDEIVRAGSDGGSTKRVLPPMWYLKHRAFNVRDRLLLQVRPGSRIR